MKLEKYCAPSSLDKEEFGTIVKVITDSNKNEYELYIQTSQDQEKPSWDRLGSFFEKVFSEDFVSNDLFIETCLDLFKNVKEKK